MTCLEEAARAVARTRKLHRAPAPHTVPTSRVTLAGDWDDLLFARLIGGGGRVGEGPGVFDSRSLDALARGPISEGLGSFAPGGVKAGVSVGEIASMGGAFGASLQGPSSVGHDDVGERAPAPGVALCLGTVPCHGLVFPPRFAAFA